MFHAPANPILSEKSTRMNMGSNDSINTNKVSIVGHIAYDHIFTIPYFPPKNHSIYIHNMGTYFGGGAGNIATGIASLGGKCEIISAVGKDFTHSKYEKHLQTLNIELTLTKTPHPTACAYIFIDEQENQVTYFSWGASKDITEIKNRHCKFLHLAPCSPEICSSFSTSADFVAFEPGQDLPKFDAQTLRYCLKNSHIFFCNNYELQQTIKTLNIPRDDIFQLSGAALITYGKKGSILHSKESTYTIKAIPAKLVDPTGAGDGYRAGFWIGKLRGYSDLTACRLGSIVSSFVVTKMGAQTNIPPWEDIVSIYTKYFGDLMYP